MDLPLLFCLAGFATFLYRLKPWHRRSPLESSERPFVSIIIPCRNEEKDLPSLLSSLLALDYPHYEVVVVDDTSSDGTVQIAKTCLANQPTAQVLRAPEKPLDWGGKNWPCWIGAQAGKGELLLFTDADTVHFPHSLAKAVQYLRTEKHDLISAPPFHSCSLWWERFLGLFYILPLVATAPYRKPTAKRLFAIGQYLLVTRESYFALNGHAGVAKSLAEDMDLATRWIKSDKCYGVFASEPIYKVQMYRSFKEFFVGWKRLLRLGLPRSTISSFLEVTLVCNLFCFQLLNPRADLIVVCSLGLLALLFAQRNHGKFHWLSMIAAPLNVLLFLIITIAASLESLLKRNFEWHGRTYQKSSSGLQ